jgi:hypothetical protein
VVFVVPLEHLRAEGRDERPRQDERREHGERDGRRQLLEQEAADPRRQLGFDLWDRLLNPVGDGQAARPGLPVDRREHLLLAVDPHPRLLDDRVVDGQADVAEQDLAAGLERDRQGVQLVDGADHQVGVERDQVVAEVGGAGGGDQVPAVEGGDHVDGRQVAGLQLVPVEVDHHLPILPAADDLGDHPADRPEPVTDVDAGEVLHLLLGHRRVADGQDAQRQGAGRVVRQHDGWEGVGRQARLGPGGQRVGHRQGVGRVDVLAEEQSDDAHPGDRPALHVGHAGGLVDPPLDPVGDGPRGRPGGHPVEVGENLDGRDLERRQDVHRDRHDRDRPEDHDEQGEDHDPVDVAQR